MLIGGLSAAPFLLFWYGVLDEQFRHKSPKQAALSKMAADQLIGAPIFLASLMACVHCFNYDCSLYGIYAKLRNDLYDALIYNWYVWVPVQAINFYVVPPEFRVVVVQIVALFWNVYLSYIANRKVESDVYSAPAVAPILPPQPPAPGFPNFPPKIPPPPHGLICVRSAFADGTWICKEVVTPNDPTQQTPPPPPSHMPRLMDSPFDHYPTVTFMPSDVGTETARASVPGPRPEQRENYVDCRTQ
ncbi:unnamed protein product, partial [Cyprideis torosa]